MLHANNNNFFNFSGERLVHTVDCVCSRLTNIVYISTWRMYRFLIIAFSSTFHIRSVVFVPYGGPIKVIPFTYLMLLLF